MIHLF